MDVNSPATGSRKAAAAETQRALKRAARKLFAQRGYLDVKVADIAGEAGRSVGSFYAHFTGKEELLRSLLGDWLQEAGERLSVDPAGSDLSHEAALRARVAAYWTTYREHLQEIKALGQAALVSPDFARQISEIRHAELDTIQEHLERLRDAGHRLPGDPLVLATAFNALLEGFCEIWLAEPGAVPRQLGDDEAIDTLTGVLRHGLVGAEPGS
jgi:AcrR family transcriptional regulator